MSGNNMREEVIEVFNEKTVKNAIHSAMLMSLIDGHLHEDEWKIIQTFAETHWRDEYEDFALYKDTVKNEIKEKLNQNGDEKKQFLTAQIKDIVEQLTPELTHPQKNIVLNLVGDVMIADGVMTLEESKLFQIFMEKLGIQI